MVIPLSMRRPALEERNGPPRTAIRRFAIRSGLKQYMNLNASLGEFAR
jgi:hypothetical protein